MSWIQLTSSLKLVQLSSLLHLPYNVALYIAFWGSQRGPLLPNSLTQKLIGSNSVSFFHYRKRANKGCIGHSYSVCLGEEQGGNCYNHSPIGITSKEDGSTLTKFTTNFD